MDCKHCSVKNGFTYDQIKELCVEVDAEVCILVQIDPFMNNREKPLQINRLLNDGYFVTIDYPTCYTRCS